MPTVTVTSFSDIDAALERLAEIEFREILTEAGWSPENIDRTVADFVKTRRKKLAEPRLSRKPMR